MSTSHETGIDSVGLLAVWDEDDQWHAAAELAWQAMLKNRAVLVTTAYVLLECGNAASRTPFRNDVDEMRRRLEGAKTMIQPTEQDWADAWRQYARHEAADAGIVDHISFIVMRRLGITDAFTNDRHFKAAGFNTLF
jgi:predicted nucleic acid-binding protein